MKKNILISLAMLSMASTAMAQRMAPSMEVAGNDTVCQIFVYSPGDKDGLHVAYLDEKQTWQHIGQLCSSDYSQWGKEKRMYDPYVVHANDGTWRAVWAVNN